MDMFRKFKSIFGYENNDDEKNKIDSYGVDHSNFSLRDEIEYQMARNNREEQFKQSYNNQGITDNYPQFGKSFWGNNSENNYGFGSSNISENIEQMKSKGFPTLEETLQYQNQMNNQNSMTTPTPWGQSSLGQNSANNSYKLSLSTGFEQNGLSDNLKNMLDNQSLNNSISSQYGDAFKARPNYDDISTGITYDFPVDLHKSALDQDNEQNTIDYSLYGNGFSKTQIDEMNNDVEFNQILNDYIIPNEGGFSNRSNDRGKKTKFGISKRAYPNEDIDNLTRERANAIIYRDFYKWNGLNRLPYPIRGFVVDYGMPTSPLNAIRTVHQTLGIPKGNIIGNTTLNKLNGYSSHDYENFLNAYKRNMINHYNGIVDNDETQRENLKGWINRANRAHLAK